MDIKEIHAKILKGEDLSDEERKLLEGYNPPNEQDIANKIVKREREKAEAQQAELQTTIEDLKEQIEDSGAKGTELEKLQRQLKRAEDRNTKLKEQQEQSARDLEVANRTRAIDAVKSQLSRQLIKDHDAEFVDYKLRQITEGKTPEEITQDAGEMVKDFINSHPSMVQDTSKGGSGQGANKGGARTQPGTMTLEEARDLAKGSPTDEEWVEIKKVIVANS